MKNLLPTVFPLFKSLQSYTPLTFRKDLVAGLTVGVVLIPQGMAYAMVAGLPPVYGLYAGILPTLVYALMGTSGQLSVGPVAIDALLVAVGLSALGIAQGTGEYVTMVILLTLMIGIIQTLMGLLRLGFIVNFLSTPVVHGFTFAAAIIIAVNQMKHLLGIEAQQSAYFHEQLLYVVSQLPEAHGLTVLVGLGGIVFLLLTKRWLPRLPGSLLVMVMGTLAAFYFQWQQGELSIVGEVPKGMPSFATPHMSYEAILKLASLAGAMAVIGFTEAYSIGLGVSAKYQTPHTVNANRDLIALGLGNVLGSFFRSLPTTASFSRTAVNAATGAQTGVASVLSASLVILTLLFFTPLFYHLPQAILGAIIFVSVLGLIDFKVIRWLWCSDRYDLGMLLAAFLGTLFFGIAIGIGLGVLLSLLVLVYKTSTPHMAVLGQIEGTPYFRNVNRFKHVHLRPDVIILRFDAILYFANAKSLTAQVEELVQQKSTAKQFVLDAQSISDIDADGLAALSGILEFLNHRGVALHLVSVIGPVRDKIYRSGLLQQIGIDHIHNSILEALTTTTHTHTPSFQTNHSQK